MTEQKSFAGRRVAVTGGAGGIGSAIVARLLDAGADVYALDIGGLDAVPDGATGIQIDLTSAESVASVVSELYAQDARPIELVNSAGIAEDDVAAEEMDIAVFDRVLSVNLRGVFLTCQAFGRHMLQHGGGAIVNIASMSGNYVVNTPQNQCAYNASKAAVTALSKSLAAEWGPRGVRVNVLSPGYVDTPLNALKAHQHQQWKDLTVLGRFADPDEVAAAVVFLLSDDAAFFCGSELLMDGGYALR
jgi:NAD(P)-dependent dehydrogenase (short-subunit alcohol dehydrogenase family)